MSTDLDQDWGPPMERTARRRRWPRLLALLLVLALLVAIAFPLWLSRQLTRMDVANLASSGGPMHILVLGSDSREDLTPRNASNSAPAARAATSATRSS
jgi:hypothetical protein